MPLIRVELIDWQQQAFLCDQIAAAITVDELKAVLQALVDHLAHIEYIGEEVE